MSKQRSSKFANFLFGFVSFVVGLVACFYVVNYITLPETEEVQVTEENDYDNEINADIESFGPDISIHFLELGNKYTGDCTYIKAGNVDILIDCGSKSNSIPVVANYLNNYVTDGKLEYVIITHAHQDHYAGFATGVNTDSIFDLYDCEVIIDFSMTNQKETATTYKNYQRELADEIANGAVHYTALDCINGANGGTNIFNLGNDITLEILDSYYYSHTSSTENDYSVCCLISQGENHFLFTGDLEEKGEKYLVQMNNLPKVDLYKAGHHGSKTSSSTALMEVVQPEIVCVCCCAGSSEYTTNPENQFPCQAFIDRVAPYTDKIYVTSLCVDYKNNIFTSFNGNIVCMWKGKERAVSCSNNNTILKDSDWFKVNREWKI